MLPHSGVSSSFNILVLSNITMFTVCKGVDVLRTSVCHISLKVRSMFALLNGVCGGPNAVPCCRTSVCYECQKLSCGQLNFEVVFEYF